jgi:hypothetical protein
MSERTPEELAYQVAQITGGFGDPYAEDDNLPGEDYASRPPGYQPQAPGYPPDDVRDAIARIVDYNWADEEDDYAECADDGGINNARTGHIFESLRQVHAYLTGQPAAAGTYPPGTPMITNKYETYPAVVLAPPATVAGRRVLAWAESERGDGEYPGGVVLCAHSYAEPVREYVTCTAYTRDGGATWAAEAGSYTGIYKRAWADFTERAQQRPATGA